MGGAVLAPARGKGAQPIPEIDVGEQVGWGRGRGGAAAGRQSGQQEKQACSCPKPTLPASNNATPPSIELTIRPRPVVVQVEVDPIAVIKDVEGGAAGNRDVVDPASEAHVVVGKRGGHACVAATALAAPATV